MSRQFANLNELWSRTIAETLRSKGVTFAIICPGSRSSPLAFAFARTEGIEAISILDERSAAFFALGLAKREAVAAVLVCTSGTAAANFFPAVVEASESGVPMMVLTADRPPELRACRAGQTIDQLNLYGSYPVDQTELALPGPEMPCLRSLRQTIADLCDRTVAPRSGPVHVNVPFRDPLPPLEDASFENPFSELSWIAFLEETRPSETRKPIALDLSKFANIDRGAIVIGPPLTPVAAGWVENVAALSSALKWPVLADALSPVRNRSDLFPYLITGYDTIFRSSLIDNGLLPEKAIVIGDLPISKALRSCLERNDIELVFLNPLGGNFDPTNSRSQSLYFDFNENAPNVSERSDSSFAEHWVKWDRVVREKLETRLDSLDAFFEGKVSAILSQHLPSGCSLFVSNSMPPRDMESFWSPNDRGIDVYCSRGANGIDGILSTAMGVAHGGKGTYLLTGDLALLHDSNGALISRVFRGALTIVLINNSGGGIFEMLPVSSLGVEFEEFFVTDQQVDFSNWARTYGIDYQCPESWSEFILSITRPQEAGVRLIEVVTDRKADSKMRKQWFSEIAATLD